MAGCSAAKIHRYLDFEHCFGACWKEDESREVAAVWVGWVVLGGGVFGCLLLFAFPTGPSLDNSWTYSDVKPKVQ